MFREKGGNTAMIFALVAPVLLLAGGGAIDVTDAYMRQTALQQAADAAAVGAVARASAGYQAALKMTSDGSVPDSVTASGVQAIFNADWRNPSDTVVTGLTGNACGAGTLVCRSTKTSGTTVSTTVSSAVTVSGTFTPALLAFFGEKTIKLSATSTASDNIPSFIDFYMLLDNSPSMGLGAETADINTLVNTITVNKGSESNCAFACHSDAPGDDFYDLVVAYNLNATQQNLTKGANIPLVNLRINEVASATSSLMSTASTTETLNGQAPPPSNCGSKCTPSEFRVALYDFGPKAYITSPTALPYQVSPLTYDLNGLSAQSALQVQLQTVPSQNYAYDGYNDDTDTNLDTMMTNLGAVMLPGGASAGNGLTSATPQKILFMVTDGMSDKNPGNRQMGPLSQTTCTALKNQGIKIAILYTTYIPSSISSDGWSVANVLPIISPTDKVGAALQSCASPGLYQPVSPDGAGIQAAMTSLFQTVVASVRIVS
ncbi:TadE/TadG family type IV pilus assembly protein [Caulobacter sp. S45]|uniref:TadE/TadG family type IV pilus assembly protein n=1 Tax=Caulobacter sp. S45 TaxID=1641861 RepID=UPI0015775230|nr:pilus assembly protein TadG-related protein [Caulobacter sp. S45]